MKIAIAELVHARRVMREPFAQFRTRRDFFHPGIEVRPFLGDAARPESVDQYSIAIGGCRGIVDAFDFNVAQGGAPYPLQ